MMTEAQLYRIECLDLCESDAIEVGSTIEFERPPSEKIRIFDDGSWQRGVWCNGIFYWY